MSKKTLLILTSIISISTTLTPQSPPPIMYPGPIIISKPPKSPKPYQYLLDAIEDGSFALFRNAIKKYYTNKAQLPDGNIEQLSKKTIFAMYNTFPLIKPGIAKANKKRLKYLHILQRRALDKMQIAKGLISSTLATYLAYYMFKILDDLYYDCRVYIEYNIYRNIASNLTLLAITYVTVFGLYKYGYNKICDGTINYKEYINKKIKENERISDYIESH